MDRRLSNRKVLDINVEKELLKEHETRSNMKRTKLPRHWISYLYIFLKIALSSTRLLCRIDTRKDSFDRRIYRSTYKLPLAFATNDKLTSHSLS